MNLAVSRVRAGVCRMVQAADVPTRFDTVQKYVDGSFRNQYFLVSASDQCLVVLSFSFHACDFLVATAQSAMFESQFSCLVVVFDLHLSFRVPE